LLDDSQPGFLLKVDRATGDALWLHSQPTLLAGLVTPAGGIMLAGSNVYDSFFRFTDPDGQTVWSKANAGDGGFGSIVGVEDGPDGVYVFGHVYGNVTFLDAPLPAVTTPSLFVAKTNFAGDHVEWYSLLEGAQARSGSLGQTMVLDPTTGNLICTAIYYDEVTIGSQTFTNDSDPYRSLLVTVHADGTFAGAVDLGVSGVTGLAVDPEGKIVVGGVFDGELQLGSTTLTEAGQSDAFIARYDPDGSLLWAKRLGGSDIEYSLQVAADAQSNIYFTSEIYSDAVDFDGQPLVAQGAGDGHILNGKLSPGGNLAWLKVHGSTDDPGEETACFPGGFTADAAGNTYMSGFFGRSNFFGNIHLTSPYTLNNFLGKFDPSGNPLWVSPILTKRFSINYAELDIDAEGNCYTNGLIRDSVFFGNILVTPHPALTPRDAFLAKYAGDDGAFEWVKTLYGNVGRLQALAVHSEASILVGGTFTNILYSDDEVLNAKGGANGFLGLLGDDILVSTAEVEAGNFLLGIYPNPASDRIYLQVQDPAPALVEVFDVRGGALVQRSLEAHELDRAIDLALLPSGAYFVKITMNGRTDVRRVVME
jgi:hypothetical protein